MTDQQKTELASWERTKRYAMPQGGQMTLSFILEEERKRAKNNPTDIALPEFKTNIHACLYYIFLVDWSKFIPKRVPTKYRGDGVAFGRAIIDDWLDVCAKKSFFKDGMLSNYDNIAQVKEVIAKITNSNMCYVDTDRKPSYDYTQMEERMYEIRQQAVDAQAEADRRAEEERQLQEQARRKQEEAERKQRQQAEEQAARKLEEQKLREEQSRKLDQLVIEAQQLIDQAPLPKSTLKLYVRPLDAAEPYTAEIAWDNIGKPANDRREPDVFTGASFVEVVNKAKSYIAQLLDDIMNERQKEQQREKIKQKIEEQNAEFGEEMAKSRQMLEQVQQQMTAMTASHAKQIAKLKAELDSI